MFTLAVKDIQEMLNYLLAEVNLLKQLSVYARWRIKVIDFVRILRQLNFIES